MLSSYLRTEAMEPSRARLAEGFGPLSRIRNQGRRMCRTQTAGRRHRDEIAVMQNIGYQTTRRILVLGAVSGAGASVSVLAALSGCASPLVTYNLAVSRDAGCGCCEAWATRMRQTGRFSVRMRDEADMPALKRRLGVPTDLTSCHTAQVESYVIEGHVPAEDILRLLSERPASVRGLAVPGMPIGSPGMEQTGSAKEPFVVVAFGAARSEFARHT